MYNKQDIRKCLGRQMETARQFLFAAKLWTRVSEKLKKKRAKAGLVKKFVN
jgi:hypothetical protein